MPNHPDHRRVLPPLPTTSGVAAVLIGTTEPQLSDTVRRGHVSPPPPILAGRRLWSREHLLQAAEALDLLTDELRATLGEEASHEGL